MSAHDECRLVGFQRVEWGVGDVIHGATNVSLFAFAIL